MGAGKTSIGRALAKELNLKFYDSDQVIEERAGVDVLWIYDVEGVEGFEQREKKVIAELVQLDDIVLATGGNTIALSENRKLLAKRGKVIYLQATLEDQLQRINYSKKRPLAPEPEIRREALQDLQQKFAALYQEIADITYNTDNKSTKFVVKELIKLLERCVK